jgi:hypothetical protein
MTPLLEAALVEALRTEYIAHVLLEYPIAELLSVGRARDGWVLRLDGEYRGAPLITEVSTAMPPEAWQSELRAKYILAPANGSWAVYSRFYDLRRERPLTLVALGQRHRPRPRRRRLPRSPRLKAPSRRFSRSPRSERRLRLFPKLHRLRLAMAGSISGWPRLRKSRRRPPATKAPEAMPARCTAPRGCDAPRLSVSISSPSGRLRQSSPSHPYWSSRNRAPSLRCFSSEGF